MLVVLLIVSSSCTSSKMMEYYTQEDHYLYATGIVSHLQYNSDGSVLYLGFSELSPAFDDNTFKIVGENIPIVKNNGIDQSLALGDEVIFITAPKYFGDGYVMPIVAIAANGVEFLKFEEGYQNFLTWLKTN